MVTYKERPFQNTKSTYRALFAAQEVNVAVYLSKASGGLCALDFDRDEDLAAFLAVNPKLSDYCLADRLCNSRRNGISGPTGIYLWSSRSSLASGKDSMTDLASATSV